MRAARLSLEFRGRVPARITHRNRSFILHRGKKHVGELVFILRDHVNDIRNASQVANVEQAVMGRSVVAGELIVDGKTTQVLQADIVNNRIKGALQEG